MPVYSMCLKKQVNITLNSTNWKLCGKRYCRQQYMNFSPASSCYEDEKNIFSRCACTALAAKWLPYLGLWVAHDNPRLGLVLGCLFGGRVRGMVYLAAFFKGVDSSEEISWVQLIHSVQIHFYGSIQFVYGRSGSVWVSVSCICDGQLPLFSRPENKQSQQ